jgi:nucleoside-diphosphate-sugar epimerase
MIAKTLLATGRRVTVLDNLLHGQELSLTGPDFSFIQGDIRDISLVRSLMADHEEAVLLAALVGEPACNLCPQEALEINYLAALNLAETARATGVKRFIFASTDSCYGVREKEILTELSPLSPISLYADLKARAETAILARGFEKEFSPTVLRMATVYGLAPRMRFDLAVNLLAREATLKGKVKIFSGEQWRPMVHVADAARAFQLTLDAPPELVAGQIFNVGSDTQNIQFKALGRLLAETVPGTVIETVPQVPDLRDYFVSFRKIQKILDFQPSFSLADGLKEINKSLKEGLFPDPYAKQYANCR